MTTDSICLLSILLMTVIGPHAAKLKKSDKKKMYDHVSIYACILCRLAARVEFVLCCFVLHDFFFSGVTVVSTEN